MIITLHLCISIKGKKIDAKTLLSKLFVMVQIGCKISITFLIEGGYKKRCFVILLIWIFILFIYWPGIIGNVNMVATNDFFCAGYSPGVTHDPNCMNSANS